MAKKIPSITESEPVQVRIYGDVYSLKPGVDLPFHVQHRLARLGKEVQALAELPDQTDDWYEEKYQKVDRMMVEAMGELFYEYTDQAKSAVGRLTESQRSELIGLVFPKKAEEEEGEAPPKTKKSKSSRASKGSTAGVRKTG